MSYLKNLETFYIVSDTLSFSAAAKILRVTQPAISKQIKQLEEKLGQALLQRDRKRVVLTKAGETLKINTQPLVKALQTAIEDASGKTQRVEGVIRFGCLIDAGSFVEWSIDFQKNFPSITIQLEHLDNFQITEAVKSGHLDFGIVSTLPDLDSIKSYRIFKEQIVLVTRAVNRRDPSDYADEEMVPFVRFSFRSPLRSDVASLFTPYFNRFKRPLGIKKHGYIFAVNAFPSMVEVLLAKDCYAVMPLHTVQRHIDKKRLRVVSDKKLENDLYLIHHDHALLEQKLTVFRDYLKDRSRSLK